MTRVIEESAGCSTTRHRSAAHRAMTARTVNVPRGTASRVTAGFLETHAVTGDSPWRRAAVRALFPLIAAQLAAKHGGAR